MTSRERLLRALRHQEVDRLPWAPLIDDYYLGYLRDIGQPMNVVEALRSIGADVIERHVHCYDVHYSGGVRLTTEPEDGGRHFSLESPVGTLHQRTRYGGHTESISEFYVKGIDDVRVLQYVEEHTSFVPDYASFVAESAYIGDDGIATVSARATPLTTLFMDYMGLAGLIYALADHREEIEALMEVMQENNRRLHKVLAESPAEVVVIYEDTSTTTISPKLYERYCSRPLDEYADIVHGEGKLYLAHMCGKLKGMLHLVKDNRMDGVDSLCPPATGDVWADEALAAWPGKTVVGGLDPAKLQVSSAKEVDGYARHVLKRAAPCRDLVLSTGDATAYGTPLDNLRAVTRVVGGSPWL
jgi:uroporphyrinogen decarboxylase